MARKSDQPDMPEPEVEASAAAVPEDVPGKVPEAAAPSGAEPHVPDGQAPLGQGVQVILTGDAQQAARGGTHGEIVDNTIARDVAIAEGHVEPGTTADAAADATTSGKLPDEGDHPDGPKAA